MAIRAALSGAARIGSASDAAVTGAVCAAATGGSALEDPVNEGCAVSGGVPRVKNGVAAIAVLALRRVLTAQATVVLAFALLERGVADVALELDSRRGIREGDRLRRGVGGGARGDQSESAEEEELSEALHRRCVEVWPRDAGWLVIYLSFVVVRAAMVAVVLRMEGGLARSVARTSNVSFIPSAASVHGELSHLTRGLGIHLFRCIAVEHKCRWSAGESPTRRSSGEKQPTDEHARSTGILLSMLRRTGRTCRWSRPAIRAVWG